MLTGNLTRDNKLTVDDDGEENKDVKLVAGDQWHKAGPVSVHCCFTPAVKMKQQWNQRTSVTMQRAVID